MRKVLLIFLILLIIYIYFNNCKNLNKEKFYFYIDFNTNQKMNELVILINDLETYLQKIGMIIKPMYIIAGAMEYVLNEEIIKNKKLSNKIVNDTTVKKYIQKIKLIRDQWNKYTVEMKKQSKHINNAEDFKYLFYKVSLNEALVDAFKYAVRKPPSVSNTRSHRRTLTYKF